MGFSLQPRWPTQCGTFSDVGALRAKMLDLIAALEAAQQK
jgi:hypothetical protein